MVDKVHEKNVDDDDADENMDNRYVEIVNVFLFDDIEELEDKDMNKVQEKILDYKYDRLNIDVKAKKLMIK